ncbi:MAG: cadherin-like domain-containing protein [Desulfuromonadales bacterium]|nr:cadherin-like domain-containing protein [Desulfuromonadales bacterium]
MKKFNRFFASLLPVLLLLTFLTGNASAAMQSVGPNDPVTTLPTWYRDNNNLALMPCNDQDTPYCILGPPFDALTVPQVPITTTGPITEANFPGEGFYYSASATMPIEGGTPNRDALLIYVLEFAFLGGVTPDTGVTFLRTDLTEMRNLPPLTHYRVTHPYGTFEFETDSQGTTISGGNAIRFEDQPGNVFNYLPPLFKSAPNTGIGPFLRNANGTLVVHAATGKTYIGDAVTPVTVTGGTNGNIFKIDRLTGPGGSPVPGASWQTNLFTLMGRVFTGQIPSPMTIDRVTYAREAASEQIDVFATALPTAILSISGNGITTTNLTRDLTPNTTKYFAHIPLASTTLPTALNITNSLDTPPINYPVTLVDDVVITQASYNPVTRAMTIKADSRDNLAPLPTLTVPQFAAPRTLDATGTLVKTLPVNTIPPLTVTVTSSKLGSATAFVSVVTPPAPPVAVADTATTAANSAVTISVLANDTTTGTVTVVTSAPLNGTAVANANGTVTFTPTAGFSGAASFSYTINDTFGQISNSVSVAVTVTGSTLPAATTIFNPTGNISTITPAFSFVAIPGATGYQLYLQNNTIGTGAPTAVFTPVQAGCASGTGLCSITLPSPLLNNNAYSWQASALNTAGQGPWSNDLNFFVGALVPPAPTIISPTGTVITTTPPFTFNAVPGATGYQLFLQNNTTVTGHTSIVFTPEQAGCPLNGANGICSLNINFATPLVSTNSYSWNLSVVNAAGQGPFSAGLNFIVQ